MMMLSAAADPPLPSGDSAEMGGQELPNGRKWQYDMRREMQEILPGLFLGPYASANRKSLGTLQAHGITHIVCIRHQYVFRSFFRCYSAPKRQIVRRLSCAAAARV